MKNPFKDWLAGFRHNFPPREYREEKLLEFEQKHRITLPEDYRNYWLRHRISLRIMGPEEWCTPHDEEDLPADFLSKDFPHTKAWDDKSIHKSELGWGSPYYDINLACGAMRIVNTGCEGYYLLVVSGPERGNVWCEDRVCNGRGIYPLRTMWKKRLSFAEYIQLKNPFALIRRSYARREI